MKHLLFLVSGGGGNLKFFHQASALGFIDDIQLSVVADRKCGAIEYSQRLGLKNFTINYSRSKPDELRAVLEALKPDVIITNWHKIVDADTVQANAGKMINLHYSLLPAFGGLVGVDPINKAYEQGCKFIGPTCHFVDEGVDTGRILAQAIFTTDRSIQDAISLMFRMGCLVLLNGFYIVTNRNCITSNKVSVELFSPTLRFDRDTFDDEFWLKVASA